LFNSALRKQADNDLTGAISDYRAALKICDVDPVVHWYLGTAYLAAGKGEQAKQEFHKEKEMKNAQEMSKGPQVHLAGGFVKPVAEPTEKQEAALKSYEDELVKTIKRNWFPPKDGGPPTVGFVVAADGNIYNLEVEKSSGYESCDSSALRAVTNTGQLPPLPEGIKQIRVMLKFDPRYFFPFFWRD
jgi:TonB family protein